ncbi:hypothetical protein [Phyllobacterium calauticae]|jgi:hypothetical protein|uniref:hypothetical protein n=1 Tax=Phyllobacterium calauticae TaxID=2817027 RepID=UPI001CBCB1B8|nr:hypothetical protein [Phyllobacterium calauticae]MBZ3693265.1 hypothetical protein [Phyllobacterium calauticae]
MTLQSSEPFDIYVHWLIDDGRLTKGVVHSSAVYDGLVPMIGDVLALKWEDDGDEDVPAPYDAYEVVERYNVDNDEGVFWHIVLKPIALPPDRVAALGLNRCEPPQIHQPEQQDKTSVALANAGKTASDLKRSSRKKTQ